MTFRVEAVQLKHIEASIFNIYVNQRDDPSIGYRYISIVIVVSIGSTINCLIDQNEIIRSTLLTECAFFYSSREIYDHNFMLPFGSLSITIIYLLIYLIVALIMIFIEHADGTIDD